MYGVPNDLDLSQFVGSTLIQVCLGEFYLQFRFQTANGRPTSPGPEIGVEGRWELRDAAGAVIDQSVPNAERDAYRLQVLLGTDVVAAAVDAPLSFSLRFGGGQELRIYDSSTEYESFSIQPGDVFV